MPSFSRVDGYEKLNAPDHLVNGFLKHNEAKGTESLNAADAGFEGATANGDCQSIYEEDKLEAIAVVGFDLTFPQDATNPEEFWNLLIESRSALTDVPKDRFNLEGHVGFRENRTGNLGIRGAHFLKDDIAAFDAPFFSITPSEAACMDPQQRLLLESTYKALENAGITLGQVQGTATSVHVGSFMHDYEIMLARDPELPAKYKATGTGASMLANRVSWFLNLSGPSMTLDTACSSSLMALHLACQDIRLGHTRMGLVSGCNIIFNPETLSGLEELNFLSPEGKCFSFDARANGYSRGEGIGTVVLKPLEEALRCNDTIRAIIRNTGCNQDGRTPGITQPSSQAQARLIRQTYAEAGLDLSTTRYFESHGTGTAIGDAMEAQAIHSVFGDVGPLNCPLYVGAVKSNIGHLEGASGIAGLIKTILVLEKAMIPPNIWFEKPNPRIRTTEWNIAFPLKPTEWPERGLRRASVSSFGFGGANTHVVLDDAANFLQLRGLSGRHCTCTGSMATNGHLNGDSSVNGDYKLPDRPEQLRRLFVLSSMDEAGIQRLATAYDKWLACRIGEKSHHSLLDDLAFTLAEKRSNLTWRSFAIADSVPQLRRSLESLVAVRSTKAPRLCFVFTGQGAQWFAMGRELMQYSIYRKRLESADRYLRTLGCEWSLLDELEMRDEDSTRLSNPSYSQPICTALQLAITDLLSEWGIKPSVIVGHSSGEIAAAFAAGAVSRESALKIAYYRGLVSESVARHAHDKSQGMMAIGLSAADTSSLLAEYRLSQRVAIAAINSPNSTTISGSTEFLNQVLSILKNEGTFCRYIPTSVAYHSHYMEDAAFLYGRLLHNIQAGPMLVSESHPIMVSTVTGNPVAHSELLDVSYWVDNMIKPVRFCQAISLVSAPPAKTLSKTQQTAEKAISSDFFLEIGPHSTLKGPIREILKQFERARDIGYGSILVRGKDASSTAMDVVAQLFSLGTSVNVTAVNGMSDQNHAGRMLVDLPGYPFNHTKRYWLESRVSRNFRFRQVPHHELLGTRHADWNDLEAVWSHRIVLSEKPWIEDHKVNGLNVYPAAGILVMAIEAARQMASSGAISGYRFRDVVLRKALVVPSVAEGIEARFYLRPVKDPEAKTQSWNEFRLCVYENGDWSENCRGAIAVELSTSSIDFMNTESEEQRSIEAECDAINSRCTLSMSKLHLNKFFSDLGLDYGGAFQSSRDIKFNRSGESAATVSSQYWKTRYPTPIQPHVIHPSALDAVFQLSFPAITRGGEIPVPTLVPTAIKHMWISNEQLDGKDLKVHAKGALTGFRNAHASITALSNDNESLRGTVELEMTVISERPRSRGHDEYDQRQRYYNWKWDADVSLLSNNAIESFCTISDCKPTPIEQTLNEEKEAFCVLVMEQAIRNLSERRPPAQQHLRKYWQWMQRQVSSRNKNVGAIPDLAQLKILVKQSGLEGKLLVRVAESLEDILTGKVDALEMLFADTLLEDYYLLSNDAPFIMKRAVRYIDAMAHKNPDLRVLEIGAGTGGFTKYAMETLTSYGQTQRSSPRLGEYMFTDISPSFFGPAKERFNAATMRFKVCDIEKDPKLQGFELGHYDLILASMVLHATKNLKATLTHTRKLLKPGGKLILYEIINPHLLRIPFVFGLLPGWWRSVEQNRQWTPLITTGEWHDILRDTGFSGVDAALSNHQDENYRGTSSLISTAMPLESSETSFRRISLVIDESSKWQRPVAEQLKTRLEVFSRTKSELKIVHLKDVQSVDLAGVTCVSLVELEAPLLAKADDERLKSLQTIAETCDGLLWLTHHQGGLHKSPEVTMSTGLARVVRTEREGFKFVTLDLDSTGNESGIYNSIIKVLQQMFENAYDDCETEYTQREDNLCISRVIEDNDLMTFSNTRSDPHAREIQRLDSSNNHSLRLAIGSIGLLDTLHFVKTSRARDDLAIDEVKFGVKAVGLNFRDILVALGHVQSDWFGIECAGVVTAVGKSAANEFTVGDRIVCGLDGAFTTIGKCLSSQVTKIPDNMSFNTAAAIPTVFCTAYYSLYHWARLREGESILIHSGAGGLGQALIQLAKLSHAEIFTTVGSKDKKDLLVSLYGIPENHIFSSRTLSFSRAINRITHGRGVDVVVNSLAGDGLKSSWECIAPFGRFIEVGKKDIYAAGISPMGGLPMSQFSKNVMFASVDLVLIMEKDKRLCGELLRNVMKLARDGKISAPHPLNLFGISDIEKAFRFMQGGTHMGKIVIEFGENQDVLVAQGPAVELFDSNATYIIAGGLGGIGQSIASWMVGRGAKHLIILSRSKTHSEEIQSLLENLRNSDTQIATPSCDITNSDALSNVLRECLRSMPPVKGCIQAAMVLENTRFNTMTADQWAKAVEPKVDGSWNLHQCLPRGMDFFIMLSSYAGIVGGVGQSNYAAGNTYQDALARLRAAHGEKATAIALGPVESVGFVSNHQRIAAVLLSAGHKSMKKSDIFTLLEYHCDPSRLMVSPQQSQVITSLELPAVLRAKDTAELPWMARPMFRQLHQIRPTEGAGSSGNEGNNRVTTISAALSSAGNVIEAEEIICDAIREKLSGMLLLEKADIEPQNPLHTYGVDSLVAVEIRNWFGKILGADVAVFEILGNGSANDLAREVAKRSNLVTATVKQ